MSARSWSSRLRRPAVRGAATETVVWLVPVLVICAVFFSPRHLVSPSTAVTGLLGLGVVILAARRPDLSLTGLIVVLPFQGLLLAKLWALGMPAAVVSHLGAWKEALAIGVVVAGVRSLMATGRRLDAIDRLALAFVAFVTLYALFQPSIVPGAPAASNIRLLGFRETAGFVLLLFGARHAPLGPQFVRRAGAALLAVGVIVSAIGVYEAIFPSAWNHFVVQTIKYTRYQVAVLHTHPPDLNDIRVYGAVGGARIVRIGSVFLNPLNCAWFLILPFAVGVERAVRRSGSLLVVVATTLIGAALLLTQTRSAIIGALVVLFLAFQPAAGRGRHWRTQVAILFGGLALLAVPAAFGTGLAKRVQSANNQSDQSTAGHISDFRSGIDTIGQHPLGLGLGTGAGTGQRFAVRTDVIAENNYLEVGDELGLLPMLIFTALTVAVILRMRRASRERSDPLITAVWAGGVGLATSRSHGPTGPLRERCWVWRASVRRSQARRPRGRCRRSVPTDRRLRSPRRARAGRPRASLSRCAPR
jgi:O-Antigen ligase